MVASGEHQHTAPFVNTTTPNVPRKHVACHTNWPLSQLANENIFEWNVALIVLNPDSVYYGGYFKAKMNFPKNYPFSPPGEHHPALQTPLTNPSRLQVHATALPPECVP